MDSLQNFRDLDSNILGRVNGGGRFGGVGGGGGGIGVAGLEAAGGVATDTVDASAEDGNQLTRDDCRGIRVPRQGPTRSRCWATYLSGETL